MATQFFYNSGASTLNPGQTIGWFWWFGTAPTLITIVPTPETPNVRIRCTQPQSQLNPDNTVTYFVDVTNEGAVPATYHLSACLIVR